MAFANNMTRLVNLIELRLGTKSLNLPEEYNKSQWAKWIDEYTLLEFSRDIQASVAIELNPSNMNMTKDGYFLIDEDLLPGDMTILGVQDIDWSHPAPLGPETSYFDDYGSPFGMGNVYDYGYSFEDIVAIQSAADQSSIYNNKLFVQYKAPNMVRITNCMNQIYNKYNLSKVILKVLVKHSSNLLTISPTMMNTFEDFATADVANFLYNGLKMYDNLETVFVNSNLKLEDLKEAADKKEQISEKLEDANVSADNEECPLFIVT